MAVPKKWGQPFVINIPPNHYLLKPSITSFQVLVVFPSAAITSYCISLFEKSPILPNMGVSPMGVIVAAVEIVQYAFQLLNVT